MAASPISFSQPDSSSPPAYTVGDITGVLWRNAWLIGASTALMSAVGVGLYSLQVPTYTSTARVLVQTDQIGSPSFLSGIAAYREPLVAEPATRKLETEMALILSRQNASDVVDALEVEPSQLASTPVAQIRKAIGIGQRKLPVRSKEQEAIAHAALVDSFLKGVAVEPVRSATAETTSNVLEVGVETADPALSRRALQGMLDGYLKFGTRQNHLAGDATTEVVQGQVNQAQQELRRIEDAIVALAAKESEQATLAASVTAAAGGAGARGAAANQTDTAASQMANQVVQLQAQLDELQETYTDETQSVRRAKQRLSEARSRLAAYVRANARQTAEFSRLDRQRLLAQDRYTELRRKLDQIKLYTELTPTGNEGRVVVAAPSHPDPSKGHKKPIVGLIGAVAGVLLGLLLAALREFAFPRFHGRRDVERWLGIPLLGVLPSADAGEAVPPASGKKAVPA